MTTDFTPTGTPLVNGIVDPHHPWVLWITRPNGKVEAYDDLTPSAERVDASRVVRLGEGPETVYVYDTAYCREVVKIGCTTKPAIDRIVQQIGDRHAGQAAPAR